MPDARCDTPRSSSATSPSRDRRAWERPSRRSRPTISRIRSARATLGRGQRGDDLAVAQHRDAIGDRGNLLEPVRDVDHAGAAVAQPRDRGEQLRRLPVGERGGRLVHDQHARLGAERLGDLDHLLLGHAQRLDHGVRDRSRPRPAPADPRHAARAPRQSTRRHGVPGLERERDVLGDGQIREERRLLVDGRDAERARERPASSGGTRRPSTSSVPASGVTAPVMTLIERALAGAVLPHQGVHFASTQVERHAAARPGRLRRIWRSRSSEQASRPRFGG